MPVGSAPWISEERSSALQIAQSEVEEFTFSARNDLDWLNEHMAEIFSENQMCVKHLNLSGIHIKLTIDVAMLPRFSKHRESYGVRLRELFGK